MDTKELKAAKAELESDIEKAVRVIVEKFEDETFLYVNSIKFEFFDSNVVVQDRPFILHRCVVGIEI